MNPYQSPIATDDLFTAAEAKVVAGSANPALTNQRILLSVIVPLVFIGLVLAMFWRTAQPQMLLWLFVGYIAVNMLEKIGYGLAVLLYKSVIRKLLDRVRELESRLPPKDDLLGTR